MSVPRITYDALLQARAGIGLQERRVQLDDGSNSVVLDVDAAAVDFAGVATPDAEPETLALRNELAGCSFSYVRLEEVPPPVDGTFTAHSSGRLLASVGAIAKQCLVEGDAVSFVSNSSDTNPFPTEHGSHNTILPGASGAVLPLISDAFGTSRLPFVVIMNTSGGNANITAHASDSGATIGGAAQPYVLANGAMRLFMPDTFSGNWGAVTVAI